MSRPVSRKDWVITSYSMHSTLSRLLSAYCGKYRITKTQLFSSLAIALLTGDIKVDLNINKNMRPKIGIRYTDINEIVKINLYDREGNLINPTDFDNSLLD